jgi:hypothetical protein
LDRFLRNRDTLDARFAPTWLDKAICAISHPVHEHSGVSMLKITSVIIAASLATTAHAGDASLRRR